MSEPHVLYRCYASDNALLYVGISKHWPDRMIQHRRDKHWFGDVTKVEVEHYADRDTALAAERAAIQKERPQHNVAHNNPSLKRERDLNTILMSVTMRSGDIVALGMTGNRCPVGYVEQCDPTWVTLTLKDWLTGNYCGRTVTYRMDDVVQIERAFRDAAGVARDEHFTSFQTAWLAQ